jgi:hypothetical protein
MPSPKISCGYETTADSATSGCSSYIKLQLNNKSLIEILVNINTKQSSISAVPIL